MTGDGQPGSRLLLLLGYVLAQVCLYGEDKAHRQRGAAGRWP